MQPDWRHAPYGDSAEPIRVLFDRRSHNPLLREAALDKDARTVAWLKRYRIEFAYR